MININEYCDLIGVNLVINYYHNQNNRWCANFDKCEIKQGDLLISTFGDGNSPIEAINEWINKIKGKTMVLRAYDDINMKEFIVPDDLIGI